MVSTMMASDIPKPKTGVDPFDNALSVPAIFGETAKGRALIEAMWSTYQVGNIHSTMFSC